MRWTAGCRSRFDRLPPHLIDLRDAPYGTLWLHNISSARKAWCDARRCMLLVARHAKQQLPTLWEMKIGTFWMYFRDTLEIVNEEWKSPGE